MKIRRLILENFRRYQGRHEISVGGFTTIIGKNDAGKSTVLEALDIFFGGGTKIDGDDLSINTEGKEIRIGVVFDEFPHEIKIDRGASTSLAAEYLLNKDGLFEVHHIFNVGLARIVPEKVVISNHPSAIPVDNLLELKNTELKSLVKTEKLESECNLNNNPSMRQALYNAYSGKLQITEKAISLSKGDAANVWKSLEMYLPIYTLFKSDRVSSDQDPEAQNPMKAAINKAVANLSEDLEKVTEQVRIMVEKTANRTIEQMKESFPDMKLASELTPKFQDPKWSSIFKIELAADDGVPLNKRGSGVRRLILLSFFQAEANRKRQEGSASDEDKIPIIYGIEEPETSQHPDNQARIVDALESVVSNGDQVLITTHNPSLAKLLPVNSICFIDEEDGRIRIRESSDEVMTTVVDTLGIHATEISSMNVKVAVMVEGKSDIDALKNFYDVLSSNGDIEKFDLDSVFWIIGGGGNVKDWVELRNLDALNIPQVIIIDSDRGALSDPISSKAQYICDMTCDDNSVCAFVTEKREIENYLHPDVVERVSNGTITLDSELDFDYDRIPVQLGKAIQKAKGNKKVHFAPTDRDGKILSDPLGAGTSHCKKVITSYLFGKMTAEEIKQRSLLSDESSEIVNWIKAINDFISK